MNHVIGGGALIGSIATFSTPISANTVYKTACAYKVNDFNGAINGTVMTQDTTVDVSMVVDRMSIGFSFSNSAQVSSHIQKVEYYPTRLTNARMQYLTTL